MKTCGYANADVVGRSRPSATSPQARSAWTAMHSRPSFPRTITMGASWLRASVGPGAGRGSRNLMASLRDEIEALKYAYARRTDLPKATSYVNAIEDVLAIVDAHELPDSITHTEMLTAEEIRARYPGVKIPEARAKRQWRVLCTNCYQDLHKACDAGQECTCACRIPGSEPPEPREAREERPAREALDELRYRAANDGPLVDGMLIAAAAIIEAIDALANRLERP